MSTKVYTAGDVVVLASPSKEASPIAIVKNPYIAEPNIEVYKSTKTYNLSDESLRENKLLLLDFDKMGPPPFELATFTIERSKIVKTLTHNDLFAKEVENQKARALERALREDSIGVGILLKEKIELRKRQLSILLQTQHNPFEKGVLTQKIANFDAVVDLMLYTNIDRNIFDYVSSLVDSKELIESIYATLLEKYS